MKPGQTNYQVKLLKLNRDIVMLWVLKMFT